MSVMGGVPGGGNKGNSSSGDKPSRNQFGGGSMSGSSMGGGSNSSSGMPGSKAGGKTHFSKSSSGGLKSYDDKLKALNATAEKTKTVEKVKEQKIIDANKATQEAEMNRNKQLKRTLATTRDKIRSGTATDAEKAQFDLNKSEQAGLRNISQSEKNNY